MSWESPLIMVPLITGPILILAGYILYKAPPKEINSMYGYRTKRSMNSQQLWDFAQIYSGIKLMKIGLWYLLSIILGFVIRTSVTWGLVISFSILSILIVWMYLRVERELKKIDTVE